METMQIVEVAVIAGAALALSFVCINNRRGGGDYLCSDCRFNADKDCLKVGRPQVMVCTSYRQGSVVKAVVEKAGDKNADTSP